MEPSAHSTDSPCASWSITVPCSIVRSAPVVGGWSGMAYPFPFRNDARSAFRSRRSSATTCLGAVYHTPPMRTWPLTPPWVTFQTFTRPAIGTPNRSRPGHSPPPTTATRAARPSQPILNRLRDGPSVERGLTVIAGDEVHAPCFAERVEDVGVPGGAGLHEHYRHPQRHREHMQR